MRTLSGRLSGRGLGFFRLLREAAWVLVGQVIAAVGLFALIRLLTEYLDPHRYGDLALALTLAMLVSQCAMSGVLPGIMRFYPIAVERNDLDSYFRASVSLMVLGNLVALVLLMMVLLGLIFGGRPELLLPVAIACVFTQLSSISTTFSSIQNAARQRRVVAWHSMLEALLKLLLCWMALHLFSATVSTVIASYIVSLLLVVLSQIYFFRLLGNAAKSHKKSKRTHWLKRMWLFSKPFTLINIFTWAQSNSDRWSVDRFSSTHSVGLLSALLQVGYTPINIAIGLLTTFVAPILNQRSGDATDASRNASVAKISYVLLLLSLGTTAIATGIAFWVHDWLFGILVGKAFREVSNMLPWVVLAGGLFASAQIIATRLMSDLKPQALLKPKIVTAVLGMALNFAGAFFYGVKGVVIATVIFSLLHLIWMLCLVVGESRLTLLQAGAGR